jgi:hypothetical protein
MMASARCRTLSEAELRLAPKGRPNVSGAPPATHKYNLKAIVVEIAASKRKQKKAKLLSFVFFYLRLFFRI